MYKLITFLFGLNLLNSVKAQDTLTFKDGQRFPSKKLISSCISQARKSKAPINAEVYCDCMIKLSAPYLTIAELKNLISNGNNESNIKLFEKLKKEVPNEFEDCALSSAVNDRTNWPQSRCDLAEITPQFTRTNVFSLRGELYWIDLAINSLPVPVSPRRSTVARLLAT